MDDKRESRDISSNDLFNDIQFQPSEYASNEIQLPNTAEYSIPRVVVIKELSKHILLWLVSNPIVIITCSPEFNGRSLPIP